MITDIFAKRYEDLRFDRDWAEKIISPTVVQASYIFFNDVQPKLKFPDEFFRHVNQLLLRELGLQSLDESSYQRVDHTEAKTCHLFLSQPFQPFSSWHREPDYFCKTRLSMLEILFREAEVLMSKNYLPTPLPRTVMDGRKVKTVMTEAINELKARLRENRTGFDYTNGLLHRASDQLTTERIAEPFWEIVTDPKWKVVEEEMKEAFDRLDHGQHDAFTHAIKALESTIKIISDDNKWSTGNEKGAANYIDNLVSARSGRFIEVWEADALKAIFSNLRNPHSHGGGSNPPPRLSDSQQTWAIESCMTWIKSLVRRLS
jgi:AbiJ N-terminal domain 4